MNFFVHDDLVTTYNTPEYMPGDGTSPEFQFDAAATVAGYTKLALLSDWGKYWQRSKSTYREVRNHMISEWAPQWGTLSVADRKILVRHYTYPTTATTAELDACYPASERFDYKKDCMKMLVETCECDPHRSNVSGSEKYFNWTNDDAGVFDSGSEILSDMVL